jgi:predicted nucleic acid-binding protein
MIYPDSGCLVKFYYPEPDSPEVVSSAEGDSVLYTRLHELEIVSALEGKLFRGEATKQQVESTLEDLQRDVDAGTLVELEIEWSVVLRLATLLAKTHGAETGSRAIDTLHCAIAQHVGALAFLTTDKRQRVLAQKLGLTLLP